MADYIGEIAHCAEAGDVGGLAQAKEQWRRRALQYLKRASGTQTDPKDGPSTRKRRRLKAMHWGLALDNCMQFGTGAGLDRFVLTPEKLQTDPYTWPTLIVVPDQGPDGHCMLNALQWGWLNRIFLIMVQWDLSHGGHNDAKCAVQSVGLWGHTLLAKVASAAPHSPWGSGMRKCQVSEALDEYFTHNDWNEATFQSVLPQLLAERGEAHRMTEHNIARTIWFELKSSDIFRRVGSKMSLSRFQALVANARSEIQRWSTLQLGTFYCCQQLGLVTQALFDKVDDAKHGEGPAINQKITTSRDEVGNLRKITSNNLSLACIYYSSIENKWRQAMIAHVCDPVLGWHIDQNKRLRSTHATLEYTTSFLNGHWLLHLRRIMDKMHCFQALEDCGMTRDLKPSYLKKTQHEADLELLRDLATTFGRFVKALVYARIRPSFFQTIIHGCLFKFLL